jgi:purine nucleoside phosphorylase
VPSFQEINNLLGSYYPTSNEAQSLLNRPLDRFPSLNLAYSAYLQSLLGKSALQAGIPKERIHSGCYVCVSGPSYETPSEIQLMRKAGGDAVGMSSIPEVLVAVQYRVQVVLLSLISNEIPEPNFPSNTDWMFEENVSYDSISSMNGAGPNHKEVIQATASRAEELIHAIHIFIGKLGEHRQAQYSQKAMN